MAFAPHQSLRIRLWLVIALACLPILLLAFADYHERRQEAIASLRSDVQTKLLSARHAAEDVRSSMRLVFQIMAHADNLRSLDPADCSGLARRLLQSTPNFSDLGAVRPDGQLFCSASGVGDAPVSMADRAWFQDIQAGHDISKAYFVDSRILRHPAIVYSYPVHASDGRLLAVLFATLPLTWLDHLTEQLHLPDGWNLFLLDDTGRLLSYYPAAQRPAQPSAQAVAPFRRALQQRLGVLELEGLDGHRRMYGISRAPTSNTPLLVAVGAPLERTVGHIERGFWWRIALLVAIALASALAARYYIYNLIEAWTERIGSALAHMSTGHLGTRIEPLSPVRELGGVERGINHMAAEVQRRDDALQRLAYRDPLTDLPNRAMLHQAMAQALAPGAPACEHALLLFDVDRFKQINDTWGHAAGDALLLQMAQRIVHCAPAHATVARLGSNTFGVLTQHQSPDATLALAQRIHQALAQPYALAEEPQFYATTSCGVALASAGASLPELLLKQAEVALYQPAGNGGDVVLLFDAAMQAHLDARATLEMGLRQAIAAQAFELHYQAQVDAQGSVTGAEALLRWPSGPQGKPVSPAHFIPLAESTGLIVPIGQWVLDTACQQLARWQARAATRHLCLSINVSARQFHQSDFITRVQQAIDASGVNPIGLKLELTESAFLGDLDTTVARMQELRALGLRFALDDFGTGYASLAYLQRLPFDQLKIDQSFTRGMLGNRTSGAIVQAILVMSQALDLEVVAEGVETQDEHAFLAQHQCQGFQGYWFGRPMPIDAWEAKHLRGLTA